MSPLRKIIWITGLLIPVLIFGRWVKNEVPEQTIAYIFFAFLVTVCLVIIFYVSRFIIKRVK